MENNPPPPVGKTFLVCRELFQDTNSKEYIVIGPGSSIKVPHIPAVALLNFYAEVTSCHGSYRPTVQLRDLEDRVVWSQAFEKPLPVPDPLKMAGFALSRLKVRVTCLGKFDAVFLLNDQEVIRRPVWVELVNQPVT